jgi:glycerol uptake facilitator protein
MTAKECVAEVLGTFILIFFGNMAVHMAVYTGSMDLWGVSMLWGLAVVMACYAVGPVSGAHLNPAVTLAMACYRGFSWKKVLPYIVSQVTGAFAASALMACLWRGFTPAVAEKLGVVIGQPGSQKLMMVFSCFFPNPGIGVDEAAWAKVTPGTAFTVEAVATALLVFMILALTEDRHEGAPKSNLVTWFIGLLVAALIGISAPLTMTCMNPARDLGPRIYGYLAGYGEIAFPGPRGVEWWLYIAGPIAGALIGGAVYELVLRPLFGRVDLKANQGLDLPQGGTNLKAEA